MINAWYKFDKNGNERSSLCNTKRNYRDTHNSIFWIVLHDNRIIYQILHSDFQKYK